jgi:hypothetical protein
MMAAAISLRKQRPGACEGLAKLGGRQGLGLKQLTKPQCELPIATIDQPPMQSAFENRLSDDCP